MTVTSKRRMAMALPVFTTGACGHGGSRVPSCRASCMWVAFRRLTREEGWRTGEQQAGRLAGTVEIDRRGTVGILPLDHARTGADDARH